MAEIRLPRGRICFPLGCRGGTCRGTLQRSGFLIFRAGTGGKMIERYFHTIPLFRGLTEEETSFFLETAEQITGRAGDVLMEQAAQADALYYILSGEITVKVLDDQGVPTMVSVLGPGAMAGWSALVPPHRATAMLAVLTDVRLIRFDGPSLRELCRERPALGLRLMINASAIITQRLAEARTRLAAALEQVRH